MRFSYFLSLVLLCCIFQNGYAQKSPKFKFGFDIAKLVANAIVNTSDTGKQIIRNTKLEINTGVKGGENVWFVLDLGYAKKHQQLYAGTYDYTSSGFYYKPGIECTLPIKKKNLFSYNLGYRLAFTSFQESYAKIVKSPYWGTRYSESYSSSVPKWLFWHEISTGFRVSPFYKKYPLFTCGLSLRLKFSIDRKQYTADDAYFPGYGGQSVVVPALNLETLIYF